MNKKKADDDIGRFLTKVLRHKPELIGIEIEHEGGWAKTDELIEKVNAHGFHLDMERLEKIVRENNKQRYSFNEDKSKIRVNQGHSIDVLIPMEEKVPPDKLYHGTSSEFLDSIKEKGICSMKRQYVHLSQNIEVAIDVGSRHTKKSGHVVVLVINTKKMHEDGFVFRISANGVWQSDTIPFNYVEKVLTVENAHCEGMAKICLKEI